MVSEAQGMSFPLTKSVLYSYPYVYLDFHSTPTLHLHPTTRKKASDSFKVAAQIGNVTFMSSKLSFLSHVQSPSLSLSHFLFFFSLSDINILLVASGANVDWYFHYKSAQSHAQLYLWFPN